MHRVLGPAILMGLVLTGTAALADPGPDFIRGDVNNNDGVVSISDAYRMIIAWQGAHLGFPGFTCEAAADANDDDEFVDILVANQDPGRVADARHVFNQVAAGVNFYPLPHPDPGQDHTNVNTGVLTCESYGGEGPLEDPQASLEVTGSVIQRVSDRDGTVYPPVAGIRVVMRSTNPVGAYALKLRVPGFFTHRNEYYDDPRFPRVWEEDGEKIVLYTELLVQDLYAALASGAFAESGYSFDVYFDVPLKTPPGDYPIRIEEAEFADFESGRAIYPRLVDGVITVPEFRPPDVEETRELAPPPPRFVRGDLNNDGIVSIADVHRFTQALYSGDTVGFPELSCWAATDVDDDGEFNIYTPSLTGKGRDFWVLFKRISSGALSIAPPYPGPGPDLTPNRRPSPGPCRSYGGGLPPRDDPEATVEIVDAIAPGGADGSARITIAYRCGYPLGALWAELRLPDLVTWGFALPPEIRGMDTEGGVRRDRGGTRLFLAARVYNIDLWLQNRSLQGGDVGVLQMRACLAPGTPAGEYPMAIEAAELADFWTAQAIRPRRIDGVLRVLEPVESAANCERPARSGQPLEPPPPRTLPLTEVKPRFELQDIEVPPGESFSVPFLVHADSEIAGFSFSIDFDESVLQMLEIRRGPGLAGRLAHEETVFSPAGFGSGNAGLLQGYAVGAVTLEDGAYLAADEDHEVYDLVFRAHPDVGVASTVIRFLDGLRINSLSCRKWPYLPATFSPESSSGFVLLPCEVTFSIVPEGSAFFVRGDANRDGEIDISDPVLLLVVQFLGEGPLPCPDAADADDSGVIDITDAVSLLAHLFLGTVTIPPPNGVAGPDPTGDDLRCPGE